MSTFINSKDRFSVNQNTGSEGIGVVDCVFFYLNVWSLKVTQVAFAGVRQATGVTNAKV